MTIKIYKPSKNSMQSGLGNTKLWLAEYISNIDDSKDSLMYILAFSFIFGLLKGIFILFFI